MQLKAADPEPTWIVRPADEALTSHGWDGAWGRIRTTDTRIFNPLLYQLSYPGARERRL